MWPASEHAPLPRATGIVNMPRLHPRHALDIDLVQLKQTWTCIAQKLCFIHTYSTGSAVPWRQLQPMHPYQENDHSTSETNPRGLAS